MSEVQAGRGGTGPRAVPDTRGVRVCHLTSVHPAYDTRIFEKECQSLARAGYDVHLVAPAAASAVGRGVTLWAVPRARNRISRALVTTARVLACGWRLRARVYHFHDPELIPVGVTLRILGKRVIYDVHEELPADILDKQYLPRWIRALLARVVDVGERSAARAFSAVVAATPAIARRFPAARRVIVQNFPLPSEFGSIDGAPYASRPPLVAYVGLINEIRGGVEMVRAIEQTSAEPRPSLVLAGRFDTPALEARLRGLGGWGRVDYRGVLPRDAVVRMLAEVRIGLVLFHPRPNHVESQPNKLFEYMAAGLPVVASRFPLWQEIVEGARCGLAVDPLDPDAIAEAIGWLLAHPNEAAAMGERGRTAVRERFNWPWEEATLLACYRDLGLSPVTDSVAAAAPSAQRTPGAES
jgi:glycosyltransferase involved in cell wall biosynthesis